MNLATLTSEEKLDYLRNAVLYVRAGGRKEILCPYCGAWNYKTNELLCCTTFSEAMDAVLGRLEAIDNVDFMSNVHDRAVN